MRLLLNSSLNSYVELISVLLIFAFVLFITWFATRYMANFQRSKYANKTMQVLESVQVGSNKFLSLVKVGDQYLIIGVGKDEVNLIAKLDKEQLPDLENNLEKLSEGEGFQDLLEKMKEKFPKK